MMRRPDWRSRLQALIAAAQKRPFQWGSHDCALGLAGPAVLAMTGENLMAEFPPYGTARGAIKALRTCGYESLADFAARHFDEIHPSQARAGDLALFTSAETGHAFGIVLGERIAVVTPKGFGTVRRSSAERTFRVG